MVKQVVFSWADRHLIVDWREAYKFWSVQVEAVLGLVTMKEALEDPTRLLLGV